MRLSLKEFVVAVTVGLIAAWAQASKAASKSKIQPDFEPKMLIYCANGWVFRQESHVATGNKCRLHDKDGNALDIDAISVYDDSKTVP